MRKTIQKVIPKEVLQPSRITTRVPPSQKRTLIRHVPFQWMVTDEELEGALAEQFFDAGPDTNVEQSELSEFQNFKAAQSAIARIADAADRNPDNVVFLQSLALQLVDSLNYAFVLESVQILVALAEYIIEILDMHSEELLQPIAKTRLSWPSLVTLRDLKSTRPRKTPRAGSALVERLKCIQLGEASPMRNLSSCVPNLIARVMIRTIEENQRMLRTREEAFKLKESDPKEFSRRFSIASFPGWATKCGSLKPLGEQGAAAEWFEVGWEAFLDTTNRHPELIPEFRQLGEYKKDHYSQKAAKPKAFPKSENANIRSGIRDKIHEAFKRLARPLPKTTECE